MPQRNTKDWLTVIEAARALGVSRQAVYKAIEEGRLKGREMLISLRVWRVSAGSVEDFKVSERHQRNAERRAPRSQS